MFSLLSRIPRPLLFVAAGLVQVGLVSLMVADRVLVLREGREVTLQTRPIDPRDFLRGDYVTLEYDISRVEAGALEGTSVQARVAPVYVKLAPNAEGRYVAVSAHAEPPSLAAGEIMLAGKTRSTRCGDRSRAFCKTLGVTYGIEKYFVPEGEGLEIEKSRNDGKVAIVAAVTPNGRAAIKRLLIDGKPVYDEPSF